MKALFGTTCILIPLLGGCWLTGQEESAVRTATLPATDGTDGTDGTDTDEPDDTDPPDDTDTDEPIDTDTPDDTGDTDLPLDPFACVDVILGPVDGAPIVTGTNVNATDDFAASCNDSTGGRDVVFEWEAPADGCWILSTIGSSFDTTLAAFDACDGTELACNDDVLKEDDFFASELHLPGLTEGQRLVVVLDAWSSLSEGPYELGALQGTPLQPDVDLTATSAGLLHVGDTTGQSTVLDPGLCPYATGADEYLRWTIPESGVWSFTLDADWDGAISLFRPCDEYALDCADEAFGGQLETTLPITFDAGEVVILRVAGYESRTSIEQGEYVLTAQRQ